MKTIDLTTSVSKVMQYLAMCIPTTISKAGTVTEITGIHICREEVIRYFQLATTNNREGFKKTLDKARVLVFSLAAKDITPDNLKKVLKPIQILENEVGLPLTKVVLVNSACSGKTIMFEGSIKWFRSSHTMSLWLLILRVCLRAPNLLQGNSFKKVIRSTKSLREPVSSSGVNFAAEDEGYIKATIHTWIPLMRNLDKIFPKHVKWENRYDADKTLKRKSRNVYLHSTKSEGIYMLTRGESQHIGANIFNKIIKASEKD